MSRTVKRGTDAADTDAEVNPSTAADAEVAEDAEDDVRDEAATEPDGDDEGAEPAAADESAKRAKGSRTGTWLVAVASVLVVVTLAAAIWYAVAWARAGSDDDLAFARERDDVSRVASGAMTTLLTFDYRDVDKWFNDTANVLVGGEQSAFLAQRDAERQVILSKKLVATAKVETTAIEELNTHDGTASVVLVVSSTINGKPTASTAKTADGKIVQSPYQVFVMTMQRTDTGWKVNSVSPINSSQRTN